MKLVAVARPEPVSSTKLPERTRALNVFGFCVVTFNLLRLQLPTRQNSLSCSCIWPRVARELDVYFNSAVTDFDAQEIVVAARSLQTICRNRDNPGIPICF